MSEPRRSPRPFRSPAGWIPILLLATALAGPSASVPPGPVRAGECLVLIDTDSFYCGLCLDGLLAFCRAIPPSRQEERVRAILLLRRSLRGAPDGAEARIALKKWDGFRRANGIRFPAFCDESRVFPDAGEAGGRILIFDRSAGALRTFRLPLKAAELAEVLSYLRQ